MLTFRHVSPPFQAISSTSLLTSPAPSPPHSVYQLSIVSSDLFLRLYARLVEYLDGFCEDPPAIGFSINNRAGGFWFIFEAKHRVTPFPKLLCGLVGVLEG